ncbi:MAG: hypothetical protein LQ338_006480 [Usnochroma carphineum]|nr:MAG: hypothetical protein LQ338_006480 [Usnochroma carphineum]
MAPTPLAHRLLNKLITRSEDGVSNGTAMRSKVIAYGLAVLVVVGVLAVVIALIAGKVRRRKQAPYAG